MSGPKEKHVTGVILAAGYGSRFPGRLKQLLPLNGRPLLQHAIDNANASELDDVLIVLGHGADDILAVIEPGAARIVLNPAFNSGQSSSLTAAIRSLPEKTDGVLVLLGDQPGIASEIIDAILSRYRRGSSPLVIPRYRRHRGNPVVFDRRLVPEILELTGDAGARRIFANHEDEIEFVDFDYPAPPDIDSPEDYENAIGAWPD